MSASKDKKPPAAGRLLVAVAVAIPFLPVVAWAREAVQMYGMPLDAAFLALYLPARVLALVGLTLMFYQFVLAARLAPLERWFSRAKLIKTHRNLGKVAYLLVLLHGVGMLAFDLAVAGMIPLWTEKTFGLIGLIVLTIAVLAAWFFKPLKLSLKQWRAIHLLTYAVFPLVVWHALALGTTVNSVAAVRLLFQAMLVGYLALLGLRLVRRFRPAS